MKKPLFILLFILSLSFGVFAQQLALPRESQRQEIAQTVGDTRISIVYHRPNVKARKVWGCETTDVVPKGGVTYPCLVPYGQVWRTGANENTTFEVSRDVTVNGQPLPAGKYGLHTIPNRDEWIIIFSKDNDDWGSYTYDEKKDALRVRAKPQAADFQETMSLDFSDVTPTTAKVVLRWEKINVPFTVNVGDVSGRTLSMIREAIANRKADDVRPLNQGASFVLNSKLSGNYEEAIGWLDASIKARETFPNLSTKARILAEMGRIREAVETGERAVAVGKAAAPPANIADFEKTLAEWKTRK
ncbi:MAG: DUF2911 domain-containing protein [Acidobacteriota bacterium]|nr:DUF2911 domain-containing protein [Acidobacteriota bacterium]